jgi:hypothetical protein
MVILALITAASVLVSINTSTIAKENESPSDDTPFLIEHKYMSAGIMNFYFEVPTRKPVQLSLPAVTSEILYLPPKGRETGYYFYFYNDLQLQDSSLSVLTTALLNSNPAAKKAVYVQIKGGGGFARAWRTSIPNPIGGKPKPAIGFVLEKPIKLPPI